MGLWLVRLWVYLFIVCAAVRGEAATLRLLSPDDGDRVLPGELTLLVQVRLAADETLRQLATRVDGVPVTVRGIVVDDSDRQSPLRRLRLPLAAGQHRVELTAETSLGLSAPVAISLLVGLPAPGGAAATLDPLLRPRLYVLAVGISDYQDATLKLRFPAKDATDLARALRRQLGGLYRDVQVRLLTNAEARKAAVLDGLDWLQHQTTGRDVAVIFLAGHGIRDSATGTYYFLPADAELTAVKRSMLSQDDLQASLRSLPGKVLLFLDTCFSGQVMRYTERAQPPDVSRFVQELVSADSGVVVLASSSGRQTSQESAAWRNGAFTRALVEGLSGRAVLPGHDSITLSMLDLYVSERVKQLTGGVQTPTLARPEAVADYPIALPRPEEAPADLVPLSPPVLTPAPPEPPITNPSAPAATEVPTARRYNRDQLAVDAAAGAGYAVFRGEERLPISHPDFFQLIHRDDLAQRLGSRATLRKALLAGGVLAGLLGVGLGFGAGVAYGNSHSLSSSAPVSSTVIGLGVSAGLMLIVCPILFISGSTLNLEPLSTGQARSLADEYNDRIRPR